MNVGVVAREHELSTHQRNFKLPKFVKSSHVNKALWKLNEGTQIIKLILLRHPPSLKLNVRPEIDRTPLFVIDFFVVCSNSNCVQVRANLEFA